MPAAIATWFLLAGGQHSSLDGTVLVGTRHTKGAVCLDVAADFSGSMREEVDARDEALSLLMRFMTDQMQADDILTSVRFAQSAVLTLPPRRAAELGSATEDATYPVDGDYTYFRPALKELDRAHKKAGTHCAQRVLVAVTDGEFKDDVSTLIPISHHFDRIYMAIPDKDSNFRPMWAYHPGLRSMVVRGFDDADQLGLLYGEALAAATGQRLGRSAK
ncbi:hypothetical protein ACQP2K_25970 [Microbispora siamensis]